MLHYRKLSKFSCITCWSQGIQKWKHVKSLDMTLAQGFGNIKAGSDRVSMSFKVIGNGYRKPKILQPPPWTGLSQELGFVSSDPCLLFMNSYISGRMSVPYTKLSFAKLCLQGSWLLGLLMVSYGYPPNHQKINPISSIPENFSMSSHLDSKAPQDMFPVPIKTDRAQIENHSLAIMRPSERLELGLKGILLFFFV